MKKSVIIINGKGGVGKDTLSKSLSDKYTVKIVSSIEPVKKIAYQCGWDGQKNSKERKFLSDLKQLMIDFNDFPTKYLLKQYHSFIHDNIDIMIVFIREPSEIEKFKKEVPTATTILIRGKSYNVPEQWGNRSDDDVDHYQYDYYFDNTFSNTDFHRFLSLIQSIHGRN